MSAPKSVARILMPDETDDLIYLARTGDLDSLKESINTISQANSCTPLAILASAVDIDEEGLGSASSLLHYPAANGNVEIIQYLLSILNPANTIKEHKAQNKQDTSEREVEQKILNHQNISGNTALHWAGINGHLEAVKALIAAGANPGIVNSAGRDAVFESDVSSKDGAAECAVEMLKFYEGLEKTKNATTASGHDDEHDIDEQYSATGQRCEEEHLQDDTTSIGEALSEAK